MTTPTKAIAVLLLGVGFSFGVAHAHTQLSASSPEDGATIAAPEKISLTFSEAVRLTAVSIVKGEEDRALEIEVTAPATEFTLAAPALEPGTYIVRWRALSADTHVMSGEFTFTIAA